MIKKLMGLLILCSAIYCGYYLLAKQGKIPAIPAIPGLTAQPEKESSYATQVRQQIEKYQKPARVEVINYIKNPDHLFQKDIQEIKKMKLSLNKDSDHYIKIQFFVDETDATAPLMGQFFIFDTKTDNLIKEDSIRFE